MSYIPSPYHFILISLAAYSVWKVIGDDVITDRPRFWLRNRLKPSARGLYWYEFVACPWCFGFWVAGACYAAWMTIYGDWPDSTGEWVGAVGIWFALRAVVGLIGSVWATLVSEQTE